MTIAIAVCARFESSELGLIRRLPPSKQPGTNDHHFSPVFAHTSIATSGCCPVPWGKRHGPLATSSGQVVDRALLCPSIFRQKVSHFLLEDSTNTNQQARVPLWACWLFLTLHVVRPLMTNGPKWLTPRHLRAVARNKPPSAGRTPFSCSHDTGSCLPEYMHWSERVMCARLRAAKHTPKKRCGPGSGWGPKPRMSLGALVA